MAIHWLGVLIGAASGVVLGSVADWRMGARWRKWNERRALMKEYGQLAGCYLNHRVGDNGMHEATGGTVEVAWQPEDGLLEATGFDAGGSPEWHSYIRMSREYPGTGTGHYNNVNSIHGGIQQVIYSKHSRAFSVMGISHSRNGFAHYWKLKE